jgi:hypothetical protein
MGNEAEVTIEKESSELSAEELEAKAKAEAEAKVEAELEAEVAAEQKAEADAKLREELEAEGKTEDEIQAAIDGQAGDEIEIVREGTQPQKEFTQKQVDDIVSKRVKRLNKKSDATGEAAAATNTELEIEREKTKLLQLALEQAKQAKQVAPTMPNPEDFDEGTADPKYQEKVTAYNETIIAAEVAKQVTQATTQTADVINLNARNDQLQKKQRKHYERAADIGVKDYEATEDAALEVLGNEVANHLIDNFDDSHIIMYYLGKNPDEAKRISNLLKTSPIKGVAELGRLSGELKVKPKKVDPAPDPDEEIKGDMKPDTSAVHKRLEKLRDEAAKTGNMDKLMAFKRKHKL